MSAIKLSAGNVTFTHNSGTENFVISADGLTATNPDGGSVYNFDPATSNYANEFGFLLEFRSDGTASKNEGGFFITNGTHNGTEYVAAAGDGSASGDPFITPMM